MRLLGHRIDDAAAALLAGPAVCHTASLALGVRIFDTQCGAKLFRVTPQLESVFEPAVS